MKKILLSAIVLFVSSVMLAQTNIFPSSGNVGIGTSSPTYKLDVKGSAWIGNGLSDGIYVGTGNHAIWTRTGNTLGKLVLFSGNADRLTIDGDNGNIGIGLSNPTSILQLHNGYQDIRFLTGTNTSGYMLDIGVNDDGVNFYNNSVGRGYNFKNAAHNDLMTIISNGNIGIGTNMPESKLHLVNSVGNSPSLTIKGNLIDVNGASLSMYQDISFTAYQAAGNAAIRHYANPWQNSRSELGFLVNNNSGLIEALRINNEGNIGIAIDQPKSKLNIYGGSQDWGTSVQGQAYGTIHLEPGSSSDHFGNSITFGASDNGGAQAGIYVRTDGSYGSKMYFSTTNAYVSGSKTAMMLDESGNLGIGTTSPNDKLEVNGTIRSKKVKVEASPWPDYVFSPNFKLRTLNELEAFIQQNQHLPEVPSAQEIEINGQDLGDIQVVLLKKIEELTLYLIQENKENSNLKEQITKVEDENQELREMLQEIKKEIETIKNDKQ